MTLKTSCTFLRLISELYKTEHVECFCRFKTQLVQLKTFLTFRYQSEVTSLEKLGPLKYIARLYFRYVYCYIQKTG